MTKTVKKQVLKPVIRFDLNVIVPVFEKLRGDSGGKKWTYSAILFTNPDEVSAMVEMLRVKTPVSTLWKIIMNKWHAFLSSSIMIRNSDCKMRGFA